MQIFKSIRSEYAFTAYYILCSELHKLPEYI